MMNTNPQMTSVEETIRMPDWRSASPKKRNTRRPHTSRTTLPVNPAISPVAAIHSRGMANSSFIVRLPQRARASSLVGDASPSSWPARGSLDHQDVRMGGEQRLREHGVERAKPQKRDHHRLVDRPADALGAAGGGHALVAAHDRDDRPEYRRLQHRPPQVGGRGVGEQRVPERPQRLLVGDRREETTEQAE